MQLITKSVKRTAGLFTLLIFILPPAVRGAGPENPAEKLIKLTADTSIVTLVPGDVPERFQGLVQWKPADTAGRSLALEQRRSDAGPFRDFRIEFRPGGAGKEEPAWSLCSLRVTVLTGKSRGYEFYQKKYRELFGGEGQPIGLDGGEGEQWFIKGAYYLLLSRLSAFNDRVSIQIYLIEGYD